MDIAREYTEFWVHQQQVRDAVGRPGADRPELVRPVLDTFLRSLPHVLRAHARPDGTAVRVRVPGPAGGTWYAVRDGGRWRMADGGVVDLPAGGVAASVEMGHDDLWRLATRGITVAEGRRRAVAAGDTVLVGAVTSLLAVVA